MKHAFAGTRDCELAVSATFEAGVVSLAVADNGNGMPGGRDNGGEQGFGLVLIDAIAKQLEGTIRIEGGKGTRVVLAFRP
jgi:two-component sensor histidine kinase